MNSVFRRIDSSVFPHLGFWTALIAVATMGALLYGLTVELQRSSARVEHTHAVLETISDVDEHLSRAESTHRGHVITLSDGFLAERDQALTALATAAGVLVRQVADNEAQHARAAVLQDNAQKRAAMMKSSTGASAAESADFVRVGALLSAEIRRLTDERRRLEERRLSERRQAEKDVHERIGRMLLASAALALLIIIPSFLAFVFESRARRRVEAMLRDMAGSIPGAIFRARVSAAGVADFDYLSPNVTALTGIAPAAARRHPAVLWATVAEHDRSGLEAAYAHAQEALSPLQYDFRITPTSGDLRWIRVSAAPAKAGHGAIVWNGHFADIDAQKALEVQLQEAKEAADAASRAKSTFLAVMSHEIRTPMNGVLGMLELLSLTSLDADQRRIVSVIRESGRSLQRIIDDILDFSKIEAGKLDVAPEPASVRRVVETTRNMYAGNASSKGLVLKCSVDDEISPALIVDPHRLGQILNNLTSNAIKFTNEGQVEISTRLQHRADGVETVRFEVRDSGIGMSPEAQSRLFQPFAQATGETARTFGGTGLGLSISKRLAELMGGSIEVDSASGVGTTMSVILPLRIADARELRDPAAHPDNDSDKAGSGGLRSAPSIEQAEREGTLVLVVDDHPTNRMLMCRQMNVLGYAADTAENGLEALDKWKSGRYALLVTDCNMPDMDGYELSRLIRRLEGMRGDQRTPIIACTANALRGEAEKCFAAGMDDYLPKPVQVPQLAAKLRQWLPLPAAVAEGPHTAGSGHTPAPGGGAREAIDRGVLANISGGDRAAETDILSGFLDATAEDMRDMQGAIARGDFTGSKRAAHRVKGAAAMVGAADLARRCAAAESASEAEDLGAVKSAAALMADEIERVTRYVASLQSQGA